MGSTVTPSPAAPHAVERRVRHALAAQPGLNIADLVVHQLREGVCVTGVVESSAAAAINDVVKAACGMDRVVNRLIVRRVGAERIEPT